MKGGVMSKIAFTVVALLGLASTANAQDRAHRRYAQRTDPYALVYEFWAYHQVPDEYNPALMRFGGAGIVVGTNLRCKVCGTVGHVNCGAAVPLFFTHFTWELMP
jgi:hypothetical protein